MLKLSIITINFNDAIGLQKTIESVVSQDFDNFEYIVIDGGSSDNSKSVIEKYQCKITYWVSEKDNGIYNAMNKGILKARGEYCLFLNSGDWLFNSEVLKNVFKLESLADLIACDMVFDSGSKSIKINHQPDNIGFLYMMRTSLWHPATFIKRILFEKHGLYNEQYQIASDYDFFLKNTMLERVSYKHISVALSVFNVRGISSSEKNQELIKQERTSIQKKYFNTLFIDAANEHNNLIETQDFKLFQSLQKKLIFTFYKKLYNVKQFIINNFLI